MRLIICLVTHLLVLEKMKSDEAEGMGFVFVAGKSDIRRGRAPVGMASSSSPSSSVTSSFTKKYEIMDA